MRGPDTRTHIKQIALKLFAARGIDNVSVRDILVAAKQKNGGSLHYHFGSKEALVLELVSDGAQRIDAWRLQQLDALEALETPPTLRDIVKLLADPLGPRCTADQGDDTGYIPFMNSLLVRHHAMFLEGVDGQDAGFKRCVAHLRALLPDIPTELFNQRLRLMMLYLFTAVSAREQTGDRSTWYRLWEHPASEENFIDSVEGMLREPASAATRAAMKSASKSAPRPRTAR
ncbi:helix-turn-helix domain containing protein [Variovorax sp. LjRoot84]|uniref:TetR/AcrR family transcriptional regulator n=1 Tax=Variovorax sp. LjRoot84 TaxID=3342340 RepID=UPI003ECF28CA